MIVLTIRALFSLWSQDTCVVCEDGGRISIVGETSQIRLMVGREDGREITFERPLNSRTEVPN